MGEKEARICFSKTKHVLFNSSKNDPGWERERVIRLTREGTLMFPE